MKTEYYKITGMSCAACSASVERACRRIEGVAEANVNLIAEKLTISYDENIADSAKIVNAVTKVGFGIEPMKEGESAFSEKKVKDERARFSFAVKAVSKKEIAAALILSAVLMYVSMGQMLTDSLPVPAFADMHRSPLGFALTQMTLALCVIFIGRRYFISGIKALVHAAANMDTLVAVSCSCSFLYSLVQTFQIPQDPSRVHSLYYESSAVVLAFVMLGKSLESDNKEKTKSAIRGLLSIAPEKAYRVDADKNVYQVDAAELKSGDLVLVKAGERIPSDGTVEEGFGNIDESMFTGERVPVYKSAGDAVMGASINLDGAIYVRITRVGSETVLSGIIRIVEEAQSKKAPIAKLADKIAGVFVPSVMGIALASALIWLALGQSFSFALNIFTCVLVIACPCALGLATPTAIICGTGLGAQNGILIRSGEALELAQKTDLAIFDKTGTVTEGKLSVTDVASYGIDEKELMDICASAEQFSEHPLAKAVINASSRILDADPGSFENISGKGVKCVIGGKTVICGNYTLMEECGIDTDEAEEFIYETSKTGKSLIFAALDGRLAGCIALADTVREGAAKAVSALHEMGIKVILLTGDNMAAANYISSQIGADRVIAGILPDGKADAVTQFREMGHTVMMIGDGINDAPALAAADVGCAVAAGSDVAIDSADIILMRDDPEDAAKAVRLSKMTIGNVRQNLFWAFFYNCIGIPVAAGILYPVNGMLLSPMIGGLAMAFSSFFVVSNALRLKRKKL